MAPLQIITDDSIIKGALTVFAALISTVLFLGGYVVNNTLKEIKQDRKDRSIQANAFATAMQSNADAINTKFTALNALAMKSDKRHSLQSREIYYLKSEHEEQKKKLDGHSLKIESHGEKLIEHSAELKSLKQKIK